MKTNIRKKSCRGMIYAASFIRNILLCLFILLIYLKCECNDDAKKADIKEQKVTIAAVGDIYLGGVAEKYIEKNGFSYPFKSVLPLFENCDLVLGNLETPLTNATVPFIKNKTYIFKMHPSYAEILKAGRFNVVSIANNHIMDYGNKGLEDTIKALKEKGIEFTGAGLNLNTDEARRPYIVTKNNIIVAFLSYSSILPERFAADFKKPGVAPSMETLVRNDIRRAKLNADVVVVSIHWGKEYESIPGDAQTYLGHSMIDSGADLVIGHHPHCIQSLEYYKRGAIAYSLGNFAFASYNDKAREALLLLATFKKDDKEVILEGLKIVPLLVKNNIVRFQPAVLKGEKASQVLNRVAKISANKKVAVSIKDDFGILEKSTYDSSKKEEKVKITRKKKSYYKHTVKKGETLKQIAEKYNVITEDIKNLNGLKNNKLKPGQILKIKPK